MAVFGTNVEMSLYDSKQVPKWRYLVEKIQINGSKTCSCESSWNEDMKTGVGFVSSSNTSRENQQNVFPK